MRRIPSRLPAIFCTNWRSLKTSVFFTLQMEDEIAAAAAALGASYAGSLGVTGTSGPVHC